MEGGKAAAQGQAVSRLQQWFLLLSLQRKRLEAGELRWEFCLLPVENPPCSLFEIGSIGEEVEWERKAVSLWCERGWGEVVNSETYFRAKVD